MGGEATSPSLSDSEPALPSKPTEPRISTAGTRKHPELLEKPFNVGKVQFAPVVIPWERRLQTLVVLIWCTSQIMSIVISLVLIRSSGLTLIAFIMYVTWMLFYQDYHLTGGRANKWFRSHVFWRYFRDYFPIHLIKTHDLDPQKTYIFGYHPHGIISLGALCNFATEATGFSEKFPGINLRVLTLGTNFKIPFFGHLCSFLGVADSSKESCNYILSQGAGNSLMLVLGGAKEALDARPGSYELTLESRKGFVKIALRHGASLVPVFSFGENDVFDQVANPKGSRVRKLQDALQKQMGFAIPFVIGRGVFTYNYGILPHRKPIYSVVGKPIDLPKLEEHEITAEIIDFYHGKYKESLFQLFEQNKGKYEGTPGATLKVH
jgi:hypothetical protein